MLRQVISRMCYFFLICGFFGAFKMITDPASVIRKFGGPLDGWDLWCGWLGVIGVIITAGLESYSMLRIDLGKIRRLIAGRHDDVDDFDR